MSKCGLREKVGVRQAEGRDRWRVSQAEEQQAGSRGGRLHVDSEHRAHRVLSGRCRGEVGGLGRGEAGEVTGTIS